MSFPYPGAAKQAFSKQQFLASVQWCEGRSQPVKCSLVPSTLDPCPRLSFPLQYWYQRPNGNFWGYSGHLQAELSGKGSWGASLHQYACTDANPFNTSCCPFVVPLAHTLALRVLIFQKCPTDVNISSWLFVLQSSRTGLGVPLAFLNPIRSLTLSALCLSAVPTVNYQFFSWVMTVTHLILVSVVLQLKISHTGLGALGQPGFLLHYYKMLS